MLIAQGLPTLSPNSPWASLAAAVLVAWFGLQLVKEFRAFIPRQKLVTATNGNSGEMSPSFWKSEFRSAVSDTLQSSIIPIMQQQAAILAKLEVNAQRQTEMLIKNEINGEQIREGQGKIGANVHGLRNDINGALARLKT